MPRVASALSAAVAKASEPKSDKVSRSLFKSLLKIAKNFDEHPAARALIYRKMTLHAMNNPVQNYYTELLDRILGPNRQLYQPSGTVSSFVDLVRLESRKPFSVNHQFSASTKVDTGFAALRNLSSIWNNYSSFDDDDDASEAFEDDVVVGQHMTSSSSSSSSSSDRSLEMEVALAYLQHTLTLSTHQFNPPSHPIITPSSLQQHKPILLSPGGCIAPGGGGSPCLSATHPISPPFHSVNTPPPPLTRRLPMTWRRR